MIDKVGGAIIKDKKILVQRKKNNRCECIIPEGKRENNETDKEHWNTIIVDEKVDNNLVKELIEQSYQLTK